MVEKLKRFVKTNKWMYHTAMTLSGKKSLLGKTLKIKKKGIENTIEIAGTALLSNTKIHITGNNNAVTIAADCKINKLLIYILGNNNQINISNEVRFNNGGSLWIDDNNCSITIGSGTTFESTNLALTDPDTKIAIGEDCMFAYDIDIRSGDSHSVIDSQTKKRINYGKDIVIGNHVWVASHVSILKGVQLADHTIVATRSLVTKSTQTAGTIIGGNPAKIIKTNVTWARERIPKND